MTKAEAKRERQALLDKDMSLTSRPANSVRWQRARKMQHGFSWTDANQIYDLNMEDLVQDKSVDHQTDMMSITNLHHKNYGRDVIMIDAKRLISKRSNDDC